jgi:hypothetical protein
METIVKIATKHLSQLKVSQLLRLSWTTWNTQQHKYNNVYNKKSVELRECTRRFKLDKDETNRMAYRYFSLMSLSQSIKDGDMLQMYLKIAVYIPDNKIALKLFEQYSIKVLYFKPSGMFKGDKGVGLEKQNAKIYLTLISMIEVMWDGKVPHENDLYAIYHCCDKKGTYLSTG